MEPGPKTLPLYKVGLQSGRGAAEGELPIPKSPCTDPDKSSVPTPEPARGEADEGVDT